MIDYLRQVHRAGRGRGGEACIVTHSFELCHIDSIFEKTGRVNSINLHRLRALCRFLKENASDFEVDTVGALGQRLRSGAQRVDAAGAVSMPRGKPALRMKRLVEQAYKRLEAKLPFELSM